MKRSIFMYVLSGLLFMACGNGGRHGMANGDYGIFGEESANILEFYIELKDVVDKEKEAKQREDYGTSDKMLLKRIKMCDDWAERIPEIEENLIGKELPTKATEYSGVKVVKPFTIERIYTNDGQNTLIRCEGIFEMTHEMIPFVEVTGNDENGNSCWTPSNITSPTYRNLNDNYSPYSEIHAGTQATLAILFQINDQTFEDIYNVRTIVVNWESFDPGMDS